MSIVKRRHYEATQLTTTTSVLHDDSCGDMKSSVLYRDQVNSLSGWFQSWNTCEQTVALCSVLKKVSPAQSLFLIHVLEQNLLASNDLAAQEEEANDPEFIRSLHSLPKEQAIRELLVRLPLLRTGNPDAKLEVLRLLPEVLTYAIQHSCYIDESRQLLSYALIHPAICVEERSQFTLWLSQLEGTCAYDAQANRFMAGAYMKEPKQVQTDMDRAFGRSLGQVPQGWDCAGSRDSGIVANCSPKSGSSLSLFPVRTDGGPSQNGFTPLHSTLSAPPALQSANTSPSDERLSLMTAPNHHVMVKRTKSLTPPIQVTTAAQYMAVHGSTDSWASLPHMADFASLSPQSSVSSGSGSENHHDDSGGGGGGKNLFVEDGSGMEDVPGWLKGLRLHKYAYLFQQLTYSQMMEVTDAWLGTQNVTKGARNKILLSIRKLRERQDTLRALEKDVMEGCNLRHALNEIKLLLMTPLKAFTGCKADTPTAPTPDHDSTIPEGDLPGQFTRILGKVCTQILVSRHLDDEGVNLYLQLLDRCMSHEAFTPKQVKLLSSWAQQIQNIWHPSQKFAADKSRRSWGGSTFPLSNGTRLVRQIKPPMKPAPGGASLAPWQTTLAKPRASPVFLAPPHHPALTKHNSLNSYMLQQSVQVDMHQKRQLERTHSAPGCWGAGNNLSLAMDPEACSDPDINARLDSLCLRMTEHALGGLDTADRGSTF